MDILTSLLIVAIILLTVYVLRGNGMSKGGSANDSTPDVIIEEPSGESAGASSSSESYEDKINNNQKDNAEYFAACGESDGANYLLGCGCPESNQIDFAVNEFGSPGMDYQAYVASQAVDDQVVKNHVQFVSNVRGLGPNGDFTGRTYSPDSHDSYDPIPWVGLRRPEYVRLENSTQIPDTNLQIYLRNRNFCLKT